MRIENTKLLLTLHAQLDLGLQESVGEGNMLGAADQVKTIVRGLDPAVVLLDNSEQTVLLVQLGLGESVGENLIAEQPGDVRWWSSIPGDARGTEIAVGFEGTVDLRLGDDLHFGAVGGIANQQVHHSHELLGLNSQEAANVSIVFRFDPGDLNAALAILESFSDVLELLVRELGTEEGRRLSVDGETTHVDGTGHPAEHPQGFAFPFHFRQRCDVHCVQPLLRRLWRTRRRITMINERILVKQSASADE